MTILSKVAISIIRVTLTGLAACGLLGSTQCTGTSRSELPSSNSAQTVTADPLRSPNNYVLLVATFRDNNQREVVMYTEVLPLILEYVGVLEPSNRQFPALLSKDEVALVRSKPLIFKRELPVLSIDSVPNESCALGGVVDLEAGGIWSIGEGQAVESILALYFDRRSTEPDTYDLRSSLVRSLTCADIAHLLKSGLTVHRARFGNSFVVRTYRN